jgi:hypothetical protein
MPTKAELEMLNLISKNQPQLKTEVDKKLQGLGVKPSTPATGVKSSTQPDQGVVWRDQHVAVIDQFDFDSDTESILKNSLNGNYDKAIWIAREKEGDKEYAGMLKQVKTDSWNLAKDLKAGKISPEAAKQKAAIIQQNFNRTAQLVDKTFSKTTGELESKAAYLMYDPDTQGIMSIKDGEKKSNAVVAKKGKTVGTNVSTSKDYNFGDFLSDAVTYMTAGAIGDMGSDAIKENIDPKAGYHNVKYQEESVKNAVKSQLKPVVSDWLKTGIANINDVKSATSRQNTYDMIVDGLKYVQKYGTVDKDSKTKQEAARILNSLSGAKWKDDGISDNQTKIVEKNREAIEKIFGDMGYYGSTYLYKNHKDKFNSPEYYRGDKYRMKWVNNYVPGLLNQQTKVDEAVSKIRMTAYDKMKDNNIYSYVSDREKNDSTSGFDGELYQKVYENMLDKTGHIRSKDQLKKLIEEQSARTITQFVNGKPVKIKEVDPIYQSDLNYAYNKLVSAYKKEFNNLKSDEVDKNALIAHGFSARASEPVGHVGINLKDRSFIKAERALNVIDIFNKEIEKGDMSSVFLRKGDYNQALTLDEYRDDPKNGSSWKKQSEDFFKTMDKDLYDMDFRRETSLPGKSAYTFTNKETGKAMTMYIDKNVATQRGEYFMKHTVTSPADWAFQQNNKWDLSHLQSPLAKNLVISSENGFYKLQGAAKDANGKYVQFENRELGEVGKVSITDVERILKERLGLN